MNTTCRACLNYTDNGIRLLTLYKQYHYLPVIISNCTGIKVEDSDNDNKLPLCQSCADRLVDMNEFRSMYLESHDKLKKNLKECLKYSPNDQKQPLNNNNSGHDADIEMKNGPTTAAGTMRGTKIKLSAEDVYSNIIIDESQLLHQSNNKENNIVDRAMNMAGATTVIGGPTTATNSVVHAVSNGPAKKMRTARPSKSRKKATHMVQMDVSDNKHILYENDANLLDMNNGHGDASELQYIILQSDTKIFSCSNCEQQFISEDFLKQHIQKAHPIVTELVQTPTLSPMSLNHQVPTIYLCHLCDGRQFTSEIQLSHHMYIHSEISNGTLSDNPFPFCSCEHCLPLQGDKMIVAEDPTEAELVAMQHAIEEPQQQQQIQHQQPIKQIVQTASGKQQTLYSCSVCNKSTFKTEHRLKKHMRIHRNEQPFSCNICHKVYNAMSSLKTHQRMAHRDVTTTASGSSVGTAGVATTITQTIDNGAGTAIGSTASTIIDSANETGQVQCPECNKTFSKPHQLSVHMTVHDKNRPLGCDYCTYRFSTTAKLNAHVKLHMETGENVLQTVDAEQPDDDPNEDKVQDIPME